MDNIIAARRLRKSVLKDITNIELDPFDYYNRNENLNENINKDKNTNFLKIKNRMIVKIFISITIIFISLIIKLVFYNNIKDTKIIKLLVDQYNINYEKSDVTQKIEDFFRNNRKIVSYIVPDEICNYIKNIYYNNFKDNYINFSIKNLYYNIINNNVDESIKSLSVFSNEEINIYDDENIKQKSGIGGGPASVDVNPISNINSMDIDIEKIKSKNISMIRPVEGTITSVYGAREEIFNDIGEYHTGIDIANLINTEIKSSTTGIVTKLEYDNKYWGNYIIITTDDVTFRYAHLNEIDVILNQNINQGDIIGKMGSTGYSTGSHLHFEIAIDSRTIDPQKLVDIR